MLVLTRKPSQQIRIGNDIVVTVVKVRGNTIRIGIEAPQNVRVMRSELEPKLVGASGEGDTVGAATAELDRVATEACVTLEIADDSCDLLADLASKLSSGSATGATGDCAGAATGAQSKEPATSKSPARVESMANPNSPTRRFSMKKNSGQAPFGLAERNIEDSPLCHRPLAAQVRARHIVKMPGVG